MKRKLLLLVNPCSGRRRAVQILPEVVSLFAEYDFETRVYLTTAAGDAREFARKYAGEVDRVVCAGGDGTLNETISGMLLSGAVAPIGYIPAGTTNDLARTLGLSADPMEAARDVMAGEPMPLDIGLMNGRYFVYTASFGAFTRASYAAAQPLKNSLGHLAYLLEAMRDLPQIKPQRVRAEGAGVDIEGDMLFGSVSNSTSLGGVLRLAPDLVSLNDGKFELIMIEKPRDAAGYYPLIENLLNQRYDSEYLHIFNLSRVKLTLSGEVDWTLDGEFCKGAEQVEIQNLHSAVRIMVKKADSLVSYDL